MQVCENVFENIFNLNRELGLFLNHPYENSDRHESILTE